MHSIDAEIIRSLCARSLSGNQAYSNFSSIYTGCQYLPFYKKFREYVPSGEHVLDWGAGNGHASAFLTASGHEVTGYSFDTFYFGDIVRGKYHFQQGSKTEPVRLPFPDQSFGAVVSVGVLEHVRETGGNEIESLREIRRIMKPGGFFVCCHFPNKHSWIEWFTGLMPGSFHHHQFRYSKHQIRELCQGANLSLREIHPYGILPRTIVAEVLPPFLRQNIRVAEILNAVDSSLRHLLSFVAQNFLFIAEKGGT